MVYFQTIQLRRFSDINEQTSDNRSFGFQNFGWFGSVINFPKPNRISVIRTPLPNGAASAMRRGNEIRVE
jgi:hypothetical protein